MMELFVCRKCGVVLQCSLRNGDVLPLSEEVLKERCEIPSSPCTEAGDVCDFGLLNQGLSAAAAEAGGTLFQVSLPRPKSVGRGCGIATPVVGTSGKAPCGCFVTDLQGNREEHLCYYCDRTLNRDPGDLSIGIEKWFQDGDSNLSETCDTMQQLIQGANRVLDNCNAQEIVGDVAFLGEDGKYYVGVTTFNIIEADKDYVDIVIKGIDNRESDPEPDNGERCECGKPAGHE